MLYLSIALILLLLGGVGVLGKPLLATIMFLAFFRYGLNGLFELTELPSLQPVSGVFGCLVFALSLYGGLALSLRDVQHRTVPPFCRPVAKEAGIRKQL